MMLNVTTKTYKITSKNCKYYINFHFCILTDKILCDIIVPVKLNPTDRRDKMKPTGVVRKVDELGRIVLPISIRQTMEITSGDALEIFTDEGKIILQKYMPACVFCNNADDIVYFNSKRICENCLAKIKAEL